jgi:very-short-patch-repair endonuclease/KaiC/GvpD/RAD55 family RecA-like ATPase
MINPDNSKVEAKLKYWTRQLHDMSGRNRLLFWKSTKTSSAIIEKPEFIDLFDLLVEKGGKILAPLPDPKETKSLFGLEEKEEGKRKSSKEEPERVRPLEANEIQTNHSTSVLNKVLYNLRYTAHTIQEEQGFNVLFVTFGMLKWKESQGSDFSFAPLVLVPVHVYRESSLSPYRIEMAEDDIVVNPVLQTKLLSDFGVRLPDVSNDITAIHLLEYLATVAELTKELEGWEVAKQSTIGAFNFLTLLLIKDFENNLALYLEHPIIQILSGVDSVLLPEPDNIPPANELDDVVNPEEVFEIMDADSSQQEAIEAAKRGLSFILQGPPGTGKSQTIANIIAEFMMAGKKVLFVSQKMAALEVVQHRLTQRGLGEFCLEVHSHKMDKRKVIYDLMRSLSDTQSANLKGDYRLQKQELKQLRDELNAYTRQLHEQRYELGLSLYSAQGYLARYLDAPQVKFSISDLENVSITDLNKMLSAVREIASYRSIIETYKQNCWKGYKGTTSSLQDREELGLKLINTANAIITFAERIRTIASQYFLPTPETIQDCVDFLYVFSHFRPGIFSDSMQVAINNYLNGYRSWARYFNFHYWVDSSKLRSVYRVGARPLATEVEPVLKTAQKIYKKISTNESYTADYAKQIDDLLSLEELGTSIFNGLNLATELFSETDIPSTLELKFKQSPNSLADWFIDHSKNIGELADWANFNAAKKECIDVGLGDFIVQVLETELPCERWEESFLRRFYLLFTESILRDRPILQKFRGTMQTEMVQRFRALDLLMIENAPNEIRAKLSANKPQSSWMQAGSAETTILRREYNKKRRIMPLRKLFRETANLIQTLKPCLMMSPITVSQLLDPAQYQFDLVVFDEASQIPPEYAGGAFLRAKQAIVAGDRQQLPPTNFFQTIEGDEFDDDEDDVINASFESILNAFDSRGFRSLMLNWHYRSKDESLIAYSNYHFYDNRLYTFPNSAANSPMTGLKFIHVKDGVYKRGVGARYNLKEAIVVADLVRGHLTTNPELSLGIVTFSLSQRKAIEEAIDALRKENPELNALFTYDTVEPIFIKNLENVQGDERDVIILSVGYGKDETGKLTLNFGPINREGGARRLNVAVTRARYSLKLVASIEPEDIDLSRVDSQGAKLLRNYLEVARDGVKATYKDLKVYADAEFESPFEESVYQALIRRSVQLVPQLGVSQYRIDLAVVDPKQTGRYLLGIECDGAMYHSALTARDRDRLRQQVLEGLGWKIHRIWSRDWIQNREAEIEKVLAAINASKQEISTKQVVKKNENIGKTNKLSDNGDSGEVLENPNGDTSPPGAVPYKRRRLQRQLHTGGDAILHTAINRIASAFVAIVDAEGPISRGVAKQRVVEAWATRKGKRISDYLDLAIAFASRNGYFTVKGNFLWPKGMILPPLRVHTSGLKTRAIQDIPPEEIVLAIRACVSGAVGITLDDLIRETCRLFGLKATVETTMHIERIIKLLVSNEILVLKNNKASKGNRF